jgi:alkylhydroperoxidase/carboxymuconolactone decarboxylase family protein
MSKKVYILFGDSNIFINLKKKDFMNTPYYQSQDLKKFKNISDWSPELGKKFFDYYNSVFEESALSAREKSLIALAVAHTVQCPYCIDAYTQDGLERGVDKEEMMEAVHVAAAIRGGASLVHGVQMMEVYEKRSM